MKADVAADSPDLKRVIALAESFPGISTQLHRIQGATRSVTEVYLLGPTGVVPAAPFEEFESVEKVVRVTQSFRAWRRSASCTTAYKSRRTPSTSSPDCARWTRASTSRRRSRS
jgi:hypothetical protein